MRLTLTTTSECKNLSDGHRLKRKLKKEEENRYKERNKESDSG